MAARRKTDLCGANLSRGARAWPKANGRITMTTPSRAVLSYLVSSSFLIRKLLASVSNTGISICHAEGMCYAPNGCPQKWISLDCYQFFGSNTWQIQSDINKGWMKKWGQKATTAIKVFPDGYINVCNIYMAANQSNLQFVSCTSGVLKIQYI